MGGFEDRRRFQAEMYGLWTSDYDTKKTSGKKYPPDYPGILPGDLSLQMYRNRRLCGGWKQEPPQSKGVKTDMPRHYYKERMQVAWRVLALRREERMQAAWRGSAHLSADGKKSQVCSAVIVNALDNG